MFLESSPASILAVVAKYPGYLRIALCGSLLSISCTIADPAPPGLCVESFDVESEIDLRIVEYPAGGFDLIAGETYRLIANVEGGVAASEVETIASTVADDGSILFSLPVEEYGDWALAKSEGSVIVLGPGRLNESAVELEFRCD